MARVDLYSYDSFVTAAENLSIPIVQIPDCLIPPELQNSGLVVRAILGFNTPTLNIKYIPASWMLEAALASRDVTSACMLVENSSGNFALSLAFCARKHGLRVVAIVSDAIAAGKLPPLQASGVRIIRESEASAKLGLKESCGGARMAELLARQEGWINLGQYSSDSNPDSYRRLLAPQILKKLAGNIGIFAAALGSTGTMVGLGGALKEALPGVRLAAAIPHLGQDIPGCRDDRRLREIRFDWRSYVDHKYYLSAPSAMRSSLAMWKAGIPAGPSSGAALLAAMDFLLREKKSHRLEHYRGADGAIHVLFVCPDTLYPYFSQAQQLCSKEAQDAIPFSYVPGPALAPELVM
ncbi:MAG TPA: pyridoxal-phosphate dependent enzyme [Xanthobacteraceae bacterium]|nr:pyridoxal-phosphate dependent enzyme [Xanthobacteraceae bacterium]